MHPIVAPRNLARTLTALAIALVSPAALAGSFVKVPALDGKANTLKARVVRYTGGTNGRMVVEVRNVGSKTQTFTSKGMYFVPQGDPDKAPQRLGAAGPFEVQDDGRWKRDEEARVAPGKTVRLKLQVFCLDSHRSSPSATHSFKLADERLPPRLRRQISASAAESLANNGGKMDMAKGAIQSHVWKARNKKWIKLKGERKHEKSQDEASSPSQRSLRHKHPLQQRIGD